jgi:hypothetical protein
MRSNMEVRIISPLLQYHVKIYDTFTWYHMLSFNILHREYL